jgi:hypothetical protein
MQESNHNTLEQHFILQAGTPTPDGGSGSRQEYPSDRWSEPLEIRIVFPTQHTWVVILENNMCSYTKSICTHSTYTSITNR